MGKRILYALTGCLAGSLVGWALSRSHQFPNPLGASGATFAVWLGQRTGRLQPLDQLHKPISLFPEGVPGPR